MTMMRQDRLYLEAEWESAVRRLQPANGTITIINWAGGDPTFQWNMHIFDSYTGEDRRITFEHRCNINSIRRQDLEHPESCPVVRWFHQQLRDFFMHEADEHFMIDGKHVFDPHNENTRRPDMYLY